MGRRQACNSTQIRPDDELYVAARDGNLRATLDQQIARMLQDPKAISLQILAIQQDVTRVSTFSLGVEQSRRTYTEIGIPEEHHGLTHHAGNPEKFAKVCQIDNYCVEQFAYFLDKMKAIKEGDSTLLDNSMVLLGNRNGDAAKHDHENRMTLLAGRGGGTLSPGRYLKYGGVAMSNLWLSLMDCMGVEVERHGDSTGRLSGLSV